MGLAQDVPQRPVRDAVAVRQAAAPQHGHALRPARELSDETRLPHAWGADHDRCARGAAVDGALERLSQGGQLALAADERCVELALERGRDLRDLDEPVRAHGLALALDLERAERLELGRVVDEPSGELADDDLACGASPSSFAAIPTASPVTRRWRASVGVATTSPDSMPMRISIPTP